MLKAFLFACVIALSALPVAAQTTNPKVFLKSTGSDSNTGMGPDVPKRSLQAAVDAVPPGGSVVMLDTAGYGGATITKSLAVVVPPGINGFSSIRDGIDGIVIAAAPTDTVSLRGLFIEAGTAGSGRGIFAQSVGTLNIDDCNVRGFATGIEVATPENVQININGISVRNGATGFKATAASGKTIMATVTDFRADKLTSSAVALFAASASPARLVLNRCNLANNNIGIEIGSDAASVITNDCTFTGNTYIFFKDTLLGSAFSRGNNVSYGNTNAINLPYLITGLSAL